jgi:hypothetical protein
VNKYQRALIWILGPVAALFIIFAVVAAITGFTPWVPLLVAGVLILASGTVVWSYLAKAPQQKD